MPTNDVRDHIRAQIGCAADCLQRALDGLATERLESVNVGYVHDQLLRVVEHAGAATQLIGRMEETVNPLEVGGCTCGAKFTSMTDALNHTCPLEGGEA